MTLSIVHISLVLAGILFLCPVALVDGWGVDGHLTVCRIAQPRLSEAAASAVKDLLPAYAGDDLGSVCSWADKVKYIFPWSSALHFIDTPDHLCTYQYARDCKDQSGIKDRCVAGAINNYTTQLLTYGKENASQYNLTQALLFLSHFVGDIHQPLHAVADLPKSLGYPMAKKNREELVLGFSSDKGANTIDVHWYTRKTVLHHVWDNSIIETEEERYDDSDAEELIHALQKNITSVWADRVKTWESCTTGKQPCTNVYAAESIKAACTWAYKGVTEDSVLEDDYFLSRFPIVNLRLAQGGVRLAAILNSIFG